MSAYQILLLSPAVALIAIAWILVPNRFRFGNVGLASADMSLRSPTLSRMDDDSAFLATVAWEDGGSSATTAEKSSRDGKTMGATKREGLGGVRAADSESCGKLANGTDAGSATTGRAGDPAFVKTVPSLHWPVDRSLPASGIRGGDLPAAGPTNGNSASAARWAGARLVDVSGAYNKRSFPIPATGVTIGRNPYVAELVLSNRHVSSRHAWIGFVGGEPVLRDLNSTNGTFLNGHRIPPSTDAALRSGDTVFFASCQGEQFRFVV